MTVLTIQGTERSIDLTSQQISKHPKSIKHWVDGGSIEELYGPDWIDYIASPSFDLKTAYRPAKRYIGSKNKELSEEKP